MNADNQRTPAAERLQNQAIDTVNTEETEKRQREQNILPMPSSPAIKTLLDIFAAGAGRLDELPKREQMVSHDIKTVVAEDGNKRTITRTSKKTVVRIEIADIRKFTGTNKALKKIYVFVLQKICQRALTKEGELISTSVSFPLQELVGLGLYKSEDAARRGFLTAVSAFKEITIDGETELSKKKKITVVGARLIGPGAVSNSQCFIYPGQGFDWKFISQYFTVIPSYYYKLSNRAADLLLHIFYIARQNTRKIADGEPFNISYRSLQNVLGLPGEADNKKRKQLIKDPIDAAISEIEEMHRAEFNNEDLGLHPYCKNTVFPDEAKTEEFLDNGYLQVTITGALAVAFTHVAQKTAKQIRAYNDRKARIEEQAQAINLAKHLEEKGK